MHSGFWAEKGRNAFEVVLCLNFYSFSLIILAYFGILNDACVISEECIELPKKLKILLSAR